MPDERDVLIAEQQLEIRRLREAAEDHATSLRNIRMMLVGIGGPLNDSRIQYTREQRKIFHDIERECCDA